MKAKALISVLVMSAACATPAFANSFTNPKLNVMSNVGSAPNPTPRDLREHNMPLMSYRATPTVNVARAHAYAPGRRADARQAHSPRA